ncbi:hypothetical protein [Haloarchaeobius sp. DFWS5]|uniref:hypothetical protein n=1 Tax=Haloarchaeobius sp. DFWS5 TaxID=3446114 RepID=UPI003EC0C79D
MTDVNEIGELEADVERTYADLATFEADLDRQTRMELAMLATGLGTDANDLVKQAVHQFFQMNTRNGQLDFHLRAEYDVTFEEYLSGMSFDDAGGMGAYQGAPGGQDPRRQF